MEIFFIVIGWMLHGTRMYVDWNHRSVHYTVCNVYGIYRWTSNNTGLNWVGPFMCGCFNKYLLREIGRLLLLGRKAVTNLDRILFLLLLSSILLLPLAGLSQAISWRAVLVIMDSFRFCLSGNIFILLSSLNSFSIYCSRSWKCLFFLLALWIYQTLLSSLQSFWWEIC